MRGGQADRGDLPVTPDAPPRDWRGLRRGGAALAVLLACALAVGLVIANRSGGRPAPKPSIQVAGQPAPSPFSNAPHNLPAAAAGAARTFFTGYLAYLYGHGSAGQIRAASPALIAKLRPLSISAAGRKLHPAVLRLGARESSGTVLHVTALIGDGIARYWMRTVMAQDQGGWETTQLPSQE